MQSSLAIERTDQELLPGEQQAPKDLAEALQGQDPLESHFGGVQTQDDPIASQSAAHELLVNETFGFKFRDEAKRRDRQLQGDPVDSYLHALRTARSPTQLDAANWNPGIFKGLGDERAVYETTLNLLDEVHADERTHRDISIDPDFTTSLLAPRPVAAAAKAISTRHGLHCETLLLSVANNLTWLESNRTRLGAEAAPPGVLVVLQECPIGIQEPVSSVLPSTVVEPLERKRRVSAIQAIADGNPGETAHAVQEGAAPSQAEFVRAIDELWNPKEHMKISMKDFRDLLGRHFQVKPCGLNTATLRQALRKRLGELVSAEKEREAVAAEDEPLDLAQVPASQEHVAAIVSVPQSLDPLIKPVHVVHTISPNLPVKHAGAPSDRKTFTKDLVTDFVKKCGNAVAEIADGQVYMVEATLKGARVCILNHGRTSLTSDEVCNTLPTPWGDSSSFNYFSRAKLCTYVQCEQDDVLTGQGTLHLRNYSVQAKMFGQYDGIEWTLRPDAKGYFKRWAISFSPGCNAKDEDVQDDVSMGIMYGIHNYMFKVAFHSPAHIHYDGFALSMFRAITRAIEDWIADNSKETPAKQANKYLVVKLNCAASDLLRFSLVAMRESSYLRTLAPHLPQQSADLPSLPYPPGTNTITMNPYHCACGWHNWARQLRLHGGYYRYIGKHEKANANAKTSGALADALSASERPRALEPDFEDPADKVKTLILTNSRAACGQAFTTSEARDWIRNTKCKVPKLSLAIVKATQDLEQIGLLKESAQPLKKGRRVYAYTKTPYSELSEEAEQERKRLRIARDKFE